LDRIVLTAMEKERATRYQSAAEMKADLLRFERGRPLVGGPVPASAVAAATMAEAPTTAMRTVATATRPAKPVKGRRGWPAVMTVGLAFALLLVLITVLIVQSNFGEGGTDTPKVDVPQVVGQQFSQAQATLTGQGFTVQRVDDEGSSQPPDQVLTQVPEGDSRANKGSTVTLTVSSTTIVVPNIVGKTQPEATTILAAKRLKPNFVEQDAAGTTPGTVIGTQPDAGNTVPKSAGQDFTVITVLIAREPPVPVPDVKGQDPTAATSALNQAGFATVVRTDVPNDTVPAGQVIGTDPPAGTPTTKVTTIKLLVSTGPDLIEVPNVVGQTQDAAAQQLTGLGFNVVVQQQASTPANKGKVFAQNPAAGTKLHKLDGVTIMVGV
jgi:serine/threonine-protein kinase